MISRCSFAQLNIPPCTAASRPVPRRVTSMSSVTRTSSARYFLHSCITVFLHLFTLYSYIPALLQLFTLAEPELSGLRQERHAKTIEIAQKEVRSRHTTHDDTRRHTTTLDTRSFRFSPVSELPSLRGSSESSRRSRYGIVRYSWLLCCVLHISSVLS